MLTAFFVITLQGYGHCQAVSLQCNNASTDSLVDLTVISSQLQDLNMHSVYEDKRVSLYPGYPVRFYVRALSGSDALLLYAPSSFTYSYVCTDYYDSNYFNILMGFAGIMCGSLFWYAVVGAATQ